MISKVKDNQEITDIIGWFNMYESASYLYKNKIMSNLSWNYSLPKEFIGSSSEEVEDYFKHSYQELENVTCLILLSAVEAKLRLDYRSRISEKKKDLLSRKFRNIYKKKGMRASLEDDILKTWIEFYPEFKQIISNYKSALQYRNWLAHGRYWIPKLGRPYDVDIIYAISDNIINNIIKN